jgi:formylmethanofuran dehydrogenase subunit E
MKAGADSQKREAQGLSKCIPRALMRCIAFHGHLCPGLVYGYLVAAEARKRLGIQRAEDEEVVAVAENDSCALDALQVVLGTTAGKGNLILRNFGKNVYTVSRRGEERALRFSRRTGYRYEGTGAKEFGRLEARFASGLAADKERKRQKFLKAMDLLERDIGDVFVIQEVRAPKIPLAPLSPSVACSRCGEMTMSARLVERGNGERLCRPCARLRKRGFLEAP